MTVATIPNSAKTKPTYAPNDKEKTMNTDVLNTLLIVAGSVVGALYGTITMFLIFHGVPWAPDNNNPRGRIHYAIWPLWLVGLVFYLAWKATFGRER